MGLQINTGLTTSDGGTVASGAYVNFNTYFPMGTTSYQCDLGVWRNEQARTNGLSQIKPIEIPELFFQVTLTEQEFAALTLGAVNDSVVAYLEQFVGQGNVSIV